MNAGQEDFGLRLVQRLRLKNNPRASGAKVDKRLAHARQAMNPGRVGRLETALTRAMEFGGS